MIKAKKKKSSDYGKLRVFGWGGYLKIFELSKDAADELTKQGVTYSQFQDEYEYGGEADFHGDVVVDPIHAFYGDDHYPEIDKIIEHSLTSFETHKLRTPRTYYLVVNSCYKGELFSQTIGDVFRPELFVVDVQKYIICGKHEETTTTFYYDGKTGFGSIVDKGTDYTIIYPGGKSHSVKFIEDDDEDEDEDA